MKMKGPMDNIKFLYDFAAYLAYGSNTSSLRDLFGT
jgi:hypothetical protein